MPMITISSSIRKRENENTNCDERGDSLFWGNLFLFHRKLRPMKQKTLRKDAHSAQGKMVAEATAPRRENVPRHILFR